MFWELSQESSLMNIFETTNFLKKIFYGKSQKFILTKWCQYEPLKSWVIMVSHIEPIKQAWSNVETANKSETRLLHSSTACPIFNELVT